MPKTTKSLDEQIMDLESRIAGAKMREEAAALQRQKLQNQLKQLLHRNNRTANEPEVTTEE